MKEPKKIAFGGIVLDEKGHLLLRRVTGNYKGYVWTFPKGRPDMGESPEQAALREVREETGHECRVLSQLGDPIEGLETITTFFRMTSLKDHGDFHEETSEVRWVTLEEAQTLVSLTEHDIGRARDLAILELMKDPCG